MEKSIISQNKPVQNIFGSITLDDFQASNINEIYSDFISGRPRGISLHAHGAGNSLMAACFASSVVKDGFRVLVIVQNDYVKKSWQEDLRKIYGDAEENFILKGTESIFTNDILIGLPKAFLSRIVEKTYLTRNAPEKIKFDVLIFDSAQQAATPTSKAVIDFFNPKFILGVSADRYRTDGQDISVFYDNKIFGGDQRTNYSAMTAVGLLSSITGYRVPTGMRIDYDDRSHDDFNESITDEKDSEENISNRNRIIVGTYERLGKKQQTIAFCASVNQAIKLAEAFKAKGIKAEAIHSKLRNSDIAAFIEGFRNGELRVLTNVSKLSEGFKSPAKCVILARPFLNPRSSRVTLPLLISRAMIPPPAGPSLVLQFVDEENSKKTEKVERQFFDLDSISGFGCEQKSKIKENEETDAGKLLSRLAEDKFQGQAGSFLQNHPSKQRAAANTPKHIQIEIEKFNFLEILDQSFNANDSESSPFIFSIPLSNNEKLPLLKVEKTDDGFIARQPGSESIVFAAANNKKDLLTAIGRRAQLELAKPVLTSAVPPASTELVKFFISRNGGGEEIATGLDENKIKLLLLLEVIKSAV